MSLEQIIDTINNDISGGKEYIAPVGMAFLQYKVAVEQQKVLAQQSKAAQESNTIARRLTFATWALVFCTLVLVISTFFSAYIQYLEYVK